LKKKRSHQKIETFSIATIKSILIVSKFSLKFNFFNFNDWKSNLVFFKSKNWQLQFNKLLLFQHQLSKLMIILPQKGKIYNTPRKLSFSSFKLNTILIQKIFNDFILVRRWKKFQKKIFLFQNTSSKSIEKNQKW
jgi:hypothetical protein